MQVVQFVLVNAFLVFVAFCKNVHHRNPRYVWGTYTSTVVEKSIATSLVPSSCVHVDATLPPCRSVRLLNFPQFISNQPQNGNDSNAETKSGLTVHTTELGWAEYMGLRAPTVTVTHFDISTTVIQDPRVVVTFAMKGCRPNELPTNLNRCAPETTALDIQDTVPTSTVVPSNVSPTQQILGNTKVVDNAEATFPLGTINDIHGNAQSLEGTSKIEEDFDSARATDPLTI